MTATDVGGKPVSVAGHTDAGVVRAEEVVATFLVVGTSRFDTSGMGVSSGTRGDIPEAGKGAGAVCIDASGEDCNPIPGIGTQLTSGRSCRKDRGLIAAF